MATSTNKTAAFRVKLTLKCMSKHRYIQKNLLFGALYGLVEWKTMMARTLQSMVIGIEPWLLTFSFLNWTAMISRSCSSNKTAQHVTQLVPQSIYWKTRLVAAYTFWTCELASKILWFNTARLLSVGLCKVIGLFGKAVNAWPFGRQHSPCYYRYTATNVGRSHRKLDDQIGLHPSQPWRSYVRNHI